MPRSLMVIEKSWTEPLVVASLGLTVGAGPLFAYTTPTAGDLFARSPYVQAVLPDGQRGRGQSALQEAAP